MISILTNRYFILTAVFLLMVGLYQFKIFTLNVSIDEQDLEIKSLSIDVKTLKKNLSNTLEVNKENDTVILKLQEQIRKSNKLNDELIDNKNYEIKTLKKLIMSCSEPEVYNKIKTFNNITIKIKDNQDENNTVFNIINSIGS